MSSILRFLVIVHKSTVCKEPGKQYNKYVNVTIQIRSNNQIDFCHLDLVSASHLLFSFSLLLVKISLPYNSCILWLGFLSCVSMNSAPDPPDWASVSVVGQAKAQCWHRASSCSSVSLLICRVSLWLHASNQHILTESRGGEKNKLTGAILYSRLTLHRSGRKIKTLLHQ